MNRRTSRAENQRADNVKRPKESAKERAAKPSAGTKGAAKTRGHRLSPRTAKPGRVHEDHEEGLKRRTEKAQREEYSADRDEEEDDEDQDEPAEDEDPQDDDGEDDEDIDPEDEEGEDEGLEDEADLDDVDADDEDEDDDGEDDEPGDDADDDEDRERGRSATRSAKGSKLGAAKKKAKASKPRAVPRDKGGSPPPAPLPPALMPGGDAETALRLGRERAAGDEYVLAICQRMGRELTDLRQHKLWRSPDAARGGAALDKVFAAVISQEQTPRLRGPALVLRYMLAQRAGFEMDSGTAYLAQEEYLANRGDYELALGDFIPGNLRRHAADQAYLRNANLTARGAGGAYRWRLETIRKQPLLGLATGLSALDKATGGLQGLTLLAGEAGVGKSTLALVLGAGVLEATPTAGVLYYTFELPKDTLYTRLYSHVSGIPYAQLTRATTSDPQSADGRKQVLSAARERLTADLLPRLRIIEWQTGPGHEPLTAKAITGHITEMYGLPGVDRVLILLDPLPRLEVRSPAISSPAGDDLPARPATELEADMIRMRMLTEVQAWTRGAHRPGGEPILAIAEVRKPDHPRKRLTLADVRGHSDLVYDAHAVLLLEQEAPAAHREVVPLLVNVAKVRDGGTRGDIALDFHHTISTFRERAPGRGQPAARVEDQKPSAPQPRRFAGRAKGA
jgi:hypothetical protein